MPRVELRIIMQDVEGGMPKVAASGVSFTPMEGLAVGENMEDLSQHEIMANLCQAMMIHHLAWASREAEAREPKKLIQPAHAPIRA